MQSFLPASLTLTSLLITGLADAQPPRATLDMRLDFVGPAPMIEALDRADALSLARADFDGDGVKDLLVGYGLADGTGAVALLRGDLATLFPNHPGADEQRRQGTLSETPFLQPARLLSLPHAAELLAAGDFDADGHLDLVAAARGVAMLTWRPGDGTGRFAPPRQRPLAAGVSALAVGEVNRVDGLADLAVAVTGKDGASLLVFEGPRGALRSPPEVVPLPAPATALDLALVDDDHHYDVAVTAGREALAVLGRDRRLTSSPATRATVAPARIERLGTSPRRVASDISSPRRVANDTSVSGVDGGAVLPARLNADGQDDLIVLTADPRRLEFRMTLPAATFIVNATDDADDGVCDAGHCSLHEAIDAANASAGADLIGFDIGGGGVRRIAPTAELPTISDPVTIDGSTQPGFAGTPIVELDGSAAGDVNGLETSIEAGGTVLRSLAVFDYLGVAVWLDSPATIMEGNFIGTDATGQAVTLTGGGIAARGSCVDCLIGGPTPAARNLISGNLTNGISTYGSLRCQIQGNYIGVTLNGDTALGNAHGIYANGPLGSVGGTAPGAGNVISGNRSRGIFVQAVGMLIQGNLVGTSSTGLFEVKNYSHGVRSDGVDSLVGGTTPAARNIISGNGENGVYLLGVEPVVQGNWIGLDANRQAMGNGRAGISNSVNSSLIGGTEPGAGNAVAFNGDTGVGVRSLNVCILQNEIFSNIGPGIDRFNFSWSVALTSAASDGTSIEIAGTVIGYATSTYRVELFANSVCDPSGRGEGERYLGFTDVVTDAAGTASFDVTFAAAVAVGEVATATGSLLVAPDGCDTSEFSVCETVTEIPDPTPPELVIPTAVSATHNDPVAVPVSFLGNGHDIASTAFSIDLDHSCLAFDPTDADLDGIPDAITVLTPPAFAVTAVYDGADTDGEIDVTITNTPPILSLADGPLLTVTFTPTCMPMPGMSIFAPVLFSADPAPSWGNTTGQSVAGIATDGSVEILPSLRGDCNGDGVVDASDLSACSLEIFDGDGNFWLDVPGGTFVGDPAGCDANADTLVDAGDVVCKSLLIFGGTCGAPLQRSRSSRKEANGQEPQLTVPSGLLADPDGSVTVPITLAAAGAELSALVFSFDLDPSLVFDATDSNGDGIPDAVTFYADVNQLSVGYDAADADGELDFLLTDHAASPMSLPDGLLVEIELRGVDPPSGVIDVRFSSEPTGSFGSTVGTSVAGTTIDGSVFFGAVFLDGFESGDTTAWSTMVGR